MKYRGVKLIRTNMNHMGRYENNTIYIDKNVPKDKEAAVLLHEYCHFKRRQKYPFLKLLINDYVMWVSLILFSFSFIIQPSLSLIFLFPFILILCEEFFTCCESQIGHKELFQKLFVFLAYMKLLLFMKVVLLPYLL